MKMLRVEITRTLYLPTEDNQDYNGLQMTIDRINRMSTQEIELASKRKGEEKVTFAEIIDVEPDAPKILVPPIASIDVLSYVARLIDEGYLILPFHGHKWLNATIVDPTGQWRVADLTMGLACCAGGSPHVRTYPPVYNKEDWRRKWAEKNYRLTAMDWQQLTAEFNQHHEATFPKAFINTICPWHENLSNAEWL